MPTKLVVVGAGYWGKNLVRNFGQTEALYGICDVESANPIFKEYPGVRHYSVYEEVLASPEIDAVAIATPAETHYRLTLEALKRGKHVFVEKPLCLSEEEGVTLNHLAQENKRVLMVGHLLQYHPGFLKLKEVVHKGELGKIQYLYSNRLNLGRIRREENILWSFAPHDISMILSLIGQMPETVSTTGGYYLQQQVADVTLSAMVFPSGVRAHIFVSWLHPYKEQKLVVVGDKAMAVFDDTANHEEKLLLFPHTIDWKEGSLPVPVKGKAIAIAFEPKEPLREECRHFLHCVAEQSQPRTDAAEGLRVLKVLQAMQRSLERKGEMAALSEKPADLKKYFAHFTSVIDEPSKIGEGTTIWHFSHVLKGSTIGQNCRIGQNVVVGPNVTIGNGCKIQNNISVYEGVTLEDHVFCGPSMVFTNVLNPRSEIPRMHELKKTLVKRGATLGANCTIVCGVVIGEYAFVGAGAVVTRDVPDYALVVGAPAQIKAWMCRCGYKLKMQAKKRSVCESCGNAYQWSGGKLTMPAAPLNPKGTLRRIKLQR